jgi:cytochrome b involved in lipid metabolism
VRISEVVAGRLTFSFPSVSLFNTQPFLTCVPTPALDRPRHTRISPTMSNGPLTREAVASHNKPDDLWCIIDHKVYDLTDFVDAHPGGAVVLEQVAGTDATTAFYNLHRQEVLQKYEDLCIGTIDGEKSEVIVPKPGDLSPVPYAEPLWLRPQFKSPYFNETH